MPRKKTAKPKPKKTLIKDGYRFIFKPEHPRAIKAFFMKGYVQEHIVVSEEAIGRSLRPGEVVHHLDLNRGNNQVSNLLVLDESQHRKIHHWIDAGCPGVKNYRRKPTVWTTRRAPKFCNYKDCGKTLKEGQKKFCCIDHSILYYRHDNRPHPDYLKEDVKQLSVSQMAKKYGVSRAAIHNWCKHAGIVFPKRVFGGKQVTEPAGGK